jgi:hypothetical protein
MGETNITPKRMHQGGITLLTLRRVSPSPEHYPLRHITDKKRTIRQRKLPRIALIQIGNGYSGKGDKDIRSSWDVKVCVHRHFE